MLMLATQTEKCSKGEDSRLPRLQGLGESKYYRGSKHNSDSVRQNYGCLINPQSQNFKSIVWFS